MDLIGEILLLLALLAAGVLWCRWPVARLAMVSARLVLEMTLSSLALLLGWWLGERLGHGVLGAGALAAVLGLVGWCLPSFLWQHWAKRHAWEARLSHWLAPRRRTREWLLLGLWSLGLGTLLLVADLVILMTAHTVGGEAFAQRSRLWRHWPGLLAAMPPRNLARRPAVPPTPPATADAVPAPPPATVTSTPRPRSGPSAGDLIHALALARDLQGMSPDDIAMILAQLPELTALLQSDTLQPLSDNAELSGAAAKMGQGDLSGVMALAGDASMRQVLNDSELLKQLRQVDLGRLRELTRQHKQFQRRVPVRDWQTLASPQPEWQALGADPAAWRQRAGRTGMIAWARATAVGIGRATLDMPETGEALIAVEAPGKLVLTIGETIIPLKQQGERWVVTCPLSAGSHAVLLVVDFRESEALRSAYLEVKTSGSEPPPPTLTPPPTPGANPRQSPPPK